MCCYVLSMFIICPSFKFNKYSYEESTYKITSVTYYPQYPQIQHLVSLQYLSAGVRKGHSKLVVKYVFLKEEGRN